MGVISTFLLRLSLPRLLCTIMGVYLCGVTEAFERENLIVKVFFVNYNHIAFSDTFVCAKMNDCDT